MNSKWFIKGVLALLSAAVIGLSIYAVIADRTISAYQYESGSRANMAFENAVTHVSGLSSKLLKLETSQNDEKRAEILSDIWRESALAAQEAAELPMSDESTIELTAFFNVVGDYAKQLSLKLGRGIKLGNGDDEALLAAKNTCRQIEEKLQNAWNNGYDGTMDLDSFTAGGDSALIANFAAQDYPRIIYDGPFSETLLNSQPKGLPKGQVSEEQAKATAELWVGVSMDAEAPREGRLAAYVFSDGNGASAAVSKDGGKIISFYKCGKKAGLTILPTEAFEKELLMAAQEYAKKNGFGSCRGGYIQYYNGRAVINLVPQKGSVGLYPDMLKLWIDMESKEVVGMDATSWWMNHTDRELNASPAFTMEAAQEYLDEGLEIISSSRALIPKEDGSECDCYEFVLSNGVNEMAVYINVETGAEEEIFTVIHTNNGTFVK